MLIPWRNEPEKPCLNRGFEVPVVDSLLHASLHLRNRASDDGYSFVTPSLPRSLRSSNIIPRQSIQRQCQLLDAFRPSARSPRVQNFGRFGRTSRLQGPEKPDNSAGKKPSQSPKRETILVRADFKAVPRPGLLLETLRLGLLLLLLGRFALALSRRCREIKHKNYKEDCCGCVSCACC